MTRYWAAVLVPAVVGMLFEVYVYPGRSYSKSNDDALFLGSARAPAPANGSSQDDFPERAVPIEAPDTDAARHTVSGGLPAAAMAHLEIAIDAAETAWRVEQALAGASIREQQVVASLDYVSSRVAVSPAERQRLREPITQVVDALVTSGDHGDPRKVIKATQVSQILCVILDEPRCLKILKDPTLYSR